MKFNIVHSLQGRVRVRYPRYLLDGKQAALVQMLISLQEGIKSVAVNIISGSVLIEYEGISEAVALSYLRAIDDKYLKNEELLKSVATPVAQESLLYVLLEMVATHYIKKFLIPFPIRRILSAFGILPRARKALGSIVRGKLFCADTLDATAIILSYATGDVDTSSSIRLLLNMGDTLEDYTKRKSYDSLASSLLNADESVQILVDGEEKSITANLLKTGDVVICRAGSVIPVDGTVISGEAMVNQSSMTGESLPVHKKDGLLQQSSRKAKSKSA